MSKPKACTQNELQIGSVYYSSLPNCSGLEESFRIILEQLSFRAFDYHNKVA